MHTVTLTKEDAENFCTMAQAAYLADRNDIGHKASGANAGNQMTGIRYDILRSLYQQWKEEGTFGNVN
jgi:hypothetical protein